MNGRSPRIADVVPALLTPFHEELTIDYGALQDLADSLVSTHGVGALFCAGHAGEVASLSPEERRSVVASVVEAVQGRVPVIAGNYTDSIDEAVHMARDARNAGADAVTVFPPPIFADGGTDCSEMPFRWFRTITEQADIPVIIFQLARSSGLGYAADTIARIAELPSVVAIKEGSGDMTDYERNLRVLSQCNPPVPVLTSNNSWLLASLAVGGDGILSGSSNVVAAEHVALWKAIQAGDLTSARGMSDRLYPLVQRFYRPPFIDMHTRMKEALVLQGRLPRATVRPPLLPISDGEREEIRQALIAAELL